MPFFHDYETSRFQFTSGLHLGENKCTLNSTIRLSPGAMDSTWLGMHTSLGVLVYFLGALILPFASRYSSISHVECGIAII